MTKKALTIGLIVVVVIGILAWGLQSRFGNKERALREAFENLFSAQSFHAKTSLAFNLPERMRNQERPFTKVTIRVEGDVAPADDRTPELSGKLLIEARGRGNIFYANGDLRILQDEVLFNLKNLPVFLNPSGSLVNKWTRVETSLLRTRNGEAVTQALGAIGGAVTYVGTDTVDDQALWHYRGSLTSEQQQALQDIFRQSASDNRALGVIARLLQANRVDTIDIWLDGSAQEIRRLSAHFKYPLPNGEEFDLATLTLDFSEYGKQVTIDRPEAPASVRPEVFGRIFGSGDVEEIQSE